MDACKVSIFGNKMIGISKKNSIPLPPEIVDQLEQIKNVDSFNISVVRLSAEEMTTENEKGYAIFLPGTLVTELAKKFYGGYASGTSAMGPMPNAIALTSVY